MPNFQKEIITRKELAYKLGCNVSTIFRAEKKKKIKRFSDSPIRYEWPSCIAKHQNV